jgi:hypothetical protein
LGLTLKEQQNSLHLPIERECVWRINESWQSCLLLHAWGITFGRSWFTVESALAFCCYMFCVLQSNIMWSSHTNYLEVYWIASNSNYLFKSQKNDECLHETSSSRWRIALGKSRKHTHCS